MAVFIGFVAVCFMLAPRKGQINVDDGIHRVEDAVHVFGWKYFNDWKRWNDD